MVMPVIKSSAYGHGMQEVAKMLAGEEMWGFGVANLDEALALRVAGIKNRILVLSYYSLNALPNSRSMRDTALVVHDAEHARNLQKKARALQTVVSVHLKVDTGTSRIGILPKNTHTVVRLIRSLPNLRLDGFFSHFSDAESFESKRTHEQLKLFLQTTDPLMEQGMIRHIACTAALVRYPDARLDVSRLGIGLYGIWPSIPARRSVVHVEHHDPLRPVLAWKTRIEQVKTIPAGTRIGYGGTHAIRRTTKLAIVPVGYADGYDRRFSNRGMMLVGGRRCRVLGSVCMNMTMLDCTDVPKVQTGDTVVLIGGQGKEKISAWEFATAIGTLPYETLSRISMAIPRIIV